MFEGDTLGVTYWCQVEHWNDQTKKLAALNKILADPAVKLESADLKDLKPGLKMLQIAIADINRLQELLTELDQLRRIKRKGEYHA